MPIDYERMRKSGPKLKAQLTRAQKKQDLQSRYYYVKQACVDAVREWEAIGAWPDNWSHWQRALDDAHAQLSYQSSYRVLVRPRLEDLA